MLLERAEQGKRKTQKLAKKVAQKKEAVASFLLLSCPYKNHLLKHKSYGLL